MQYIHALVAIVLISPVAAEQDSGSNRFSFGTEQQISVFDDLSSVSDIAGISLLQYRYALKTKPNRSEPRTLHIKNANVVAGRFKPGSVRGPAFAWLRRSDTLRVFRQEQEWQYPEESGYPFPGWYWSEVHTTPTIICSLMLALAGVLCAAGGIGGGGIYVTVLMVAGQITPHDAVPLSKSIVFFGSLSSLVLNARKSLANTGSDQATSLIDYNICRLVVPASLVGTLFGVLLNSIFAPWLIVVALCGVHVITMVMSSRKLHEQWCVEQLSEKVHALRAARPEASNGGNVCEGPTPEVVDCFAKVDTPRKIRGGSFPGEPFGWFMLLLLIICCGTFHSHAQACYKDLQVGSIRDYGTDSCAQPVMKFFFGNRLSIWMHEPVASQLILWGLLALPILVCTCLLTYYAVKLTRREDWSLPKVLAYSGMGCFAGMFAGLVGIGGGLIFSPFMLWMAVNPAVAVATSSTCVIFTASSTTFQYLFTDRVILSLAIIYGFVNLLASYCGTSLVHALQDRFHAKPSRISAIVCLGVLASTCLSVYKLITIGLDH